MRASFIAVLMFIAGTSTSFADNQNPSVVENVNASSLTNTDIRLSWTKPWDNVEVIGYNLYRDDRYFTTVFGSTNYIDRGLSSNRAYSYYIVAFDNSRNYSRKSAVVQASLGSVDSGSNNSSSPQNSGDGKPSTPNGLSAQVLSGTEVRLTWQAASGNVEGYNIYRNGQYFTTVRGSTAYTDNELRANNTYQFRVVAFGNGEYSSKSSAVSATTGNTSGSSQPSPPPPQNDNNSSGSVPAGYQLVFSDEFDSGSINGSKWNTKYRWGPNWVINNELQYYVDILSDPGFGHSPFYMNGGKLDISAIRTPDHLRGKARNQNYLSGAMTTHGKFKMRYGYVEMRAKLPRGKGLWPAFWLLHEHNEGRRPEIDVMEMLGDNTSLVYQTYHYYDNGSLRSTPSFQAPGPDYASDYHTYGMKWEPGRITWYIDGRETNRYESGNVSSEDMYILMNVALGGSWAGSPDGSTNFPATFSIDYVRAYQQR